MGISHHSRNHGRLVGCPPEGASITTCSASISEGLAVSCSSWHRALAHRPGLRAQVSIHRERGDRERERERGKETHQRADRFVCLRLLPLIAPFLTKDLDLLTSVERVRPKSLVPKALCWLTEELHLGTPLTKVFLVLAFRV